MQIIMMVMILIYLLILTFFSCYIIIITFYYSLYDNGYYSTCSDHVNYFVFVPALLIF